MGSRRMEAGSVEDGMSGRGRDIGEEIPYSPFFWMVLLGSAIILFWGIWSLPVLSLNEGRRMLVVKEMLRTGNWLLPTMEGKTYLMKPPLFYWVAASFGLLLHSDAEWVVRLPSSLGAFAVIWLTFRQVARYRGRWAALFAGLILATSYKFVLYARRAEIEMLLTLFCTLAGFSFLDYLQTPSGGGKLHLAYLFWGLAFLTKGPAALPFFLPPILAFWLLSRERRALQGLLSLSGWTIFALVGFSWYLYAFLQTGGGPWEVFFRRDILGKTVGDGTRDPFYSYFLEMILNFSPWILFLAWRPHRLSRDLLSSWEGLWFLSWFSLPFLLLSLCAIKHAKYLLPSFPAATALLAYRTEAWFQSCQETRPKRARRLIAYTAAILLGGGVVYYTLIEPYAVNYRFRVLAPMVERIEQVRGQAPVYSYRHKYVQLIYYYGHPIPRLHQDKLRGLLAQGKPFLLIAEDSYWPHLDRIGLLSLAEYRPFLHREKAARIYLSPALGRQIGR
jgi:4-amino-4-deoxy-L-arabinose transferase-like glycosyltransferase